MDQIINVNPILSLLRKRNVGRQKGIYSCCSANEYVIRAVLRRAKATDSKVLVETTANQVNQDRGYTGMNPLEFRDFLYRLSKEEGVSKDNVLLGGDHLGPLVWRSLPESEAMSKAVELIEQYVLAGFCKIHIDTSMHLGDDDPNLPLTNETIAKRGALLCKSAEQAYEIYAKSNPEAFAPVYVIGSEVPVPGGALENEEDIDITKPEDCKYTIQSFKDAFKLYGLSDVFERVIALVVQPGVEFSDEAVFEYDGKAAKSLTDCLNLWSGLVFEGHSTDYQPRQCLREMVENGIAILKVGPALTFSLREGLFSLERIETELSSLRPFPNSNFRKTLEWVMTDDDRHWNSYYKGREVEKRYAMAFSFSDRARYYLPEPRVKVAIETLLENLNRENIPLTLLSQHMPSQYRRVCSGLISYKAEDILIDYVGDRIDDYLYATIVQ